MTETANEDHENEHEGCSHEHKHLTAEEYKAKWDEHLNTLTEEQLDYAGKFLHDMVLFQVGQMSLPLVFAIDGACGDTLDNNTAEMIVDIAHSTFFVQALSAFLLPPDVTTPVKS